ncbi:hypothetical protein LTR28_013451 [Elasticomyces elasticus]|nr:hypothetical protein LTR28_013451 [Elasticomyces elasticus]
MDSNPSRSCQPIVVSPGRLVHQPALNLPPCSPSYVGPSRSSTGIPPVIAPSVCQSSKVENGQSSSTFPPWSLSPTDYTGFFPFSPSSQFPFGLDPVAPSLADHTAHIQAVEQKVAELNRRVEAQEGEIARLHENEAVTEEWAEAMADWSKKTDAVLTQLMDHLVSTGQLASGEVEEVVEHWINAMDDETGAT